MTFFVGCVLPLCVTVGFGRNIRGPFLANKPEGRNRLQRLLSGVRPALPRISLILLILPILIINTPTNKYSRAKALFLHKWYP